MPSGNASDIVTGLGLSRHPEGGWFRETWRAAAAPGERAGATAIYFLLQDDERSHWHRVDAAELWLWHAGAPLRLSIAADAEAPVSTIMLGPDVLGGQQPQALVPPGQWQSAEPGGGWVLASCVVSPAFDFAGFELAPLGWAPTGGDV